MLLYLCKIAYFFLINFFVKLQVNLGIYTTDGKSELSVLVDRAVGGSSIKDGEIEIMFHRFQPFICQFLSNCLDLFHLPFFCLLTNHYLEGVYCMMTQEALQKPLMNKFVWMMHARVLRYGHFPSIGLSTATSSDNCMHYLDHLSILCFHLSSW